MSDRAVAGGHASRVHIACALLSLYDLHGSTRVHEGDRT